MKKSMLMALVCFFSLGIAWEEVINIIKNNKFNFFDFPLLRARSVDNLQFTGNTRVMTASI